MAKFIDFVEITPRPSTRRRFAIINKKSMGAIAFIEWCQSWRMYVVSFSMGTVWSHDCLNDIAEFIRNIIDAKVKPA